MNPVVIVDLKHCSYNYELCLALQNWVIAAYFIENTDESA